MKKLYAFALASGLALLGACSNEEPLDYDPTPIDDEGTIGYLRIEFPDMDGGTRAYEGTEVAADANESRVYEANFVFYDENDEPYASRVARNIKKDGDAAYWVNKHDGAQGARCAIIKLTKMPSSVAVIVNDGLNYGEVDLNEKAGTSKTYSYSKKDETDGQTYTYFHMSSSRYYDATQHRTNKTPITGEMLFKDETEAVKAENTDKAVKISVEHYVAKIKIENKFSETYKLDADGKLDPFANKTDKTVNEATITFKPEYAILTAFPEGTERIKKLPNWGGLPTEVQEWTSLNNVDKCWSSWVRSDKLTVKWPTLNEVSGGTLFGASSNAYPAAGVVNTIYSFDNNDSQKAHNTSVAVVGKYEVTKNGAKFGAEDGSFWLVAFEDKFEVYDSEEAAILAMGGEKNDVLVPDGVTDADHPDVPGSTYDNRWSNWSGWMKIKGKDIVTRCVKYNGGYGYYAKRINHVVLDNKNYNMVVRNHLYNISITGIGGMGVGIPDPDYPIIPVTPPDPTEQNYYLHMSIIVNPWRTVSNSMEWK